MKQHVNRLDNFEKLKESEKLENLSNPVVAIDILSHGKKSRAENVSLCGICELMGAKKCPSPSGKTGHCPAYLLRAGVTMSMVLNLIRS